MSNLFPYRTQAVRDLAHSCFGPCMVTEPALASATESCHLAINPQRRQWLQQLDENPAPLLETLATVKSTRLGIYFEALWQFFINCDPALQLVSANHPVRNNGRTLGEYDLIYYSKEKDQHYHLELAVKFYLGLLNADIGKQNCWWGPNCKDRLDLKLNRLFEHQCTLSSSPQGMAELEALGCVNVNREVAVKGMLFYPADSDQKPAGIASGHQRGKWLPLEKFSAGEENAQPWKILSRSDWLSPYYQGNGQALVTYKTLLEQLQCYFDINERPVMICSLSEGESGFYEQQRFFITGNNWPALTPQD